MNLIRLVLKRPVSVITLILAVVVFGIYSLSGMPLEYMPDMEMPMELVLVTWPGTDADSIERLVTEPIEDECETLSDINTVASLTYDNYTMVELQYNYGVDLDDAYSDLKVVMDNLSVSFPEGCEDFTIMEISMLADATMSISVTSDSGVDVQTYLNDTVAPAVEAVSGVAKVDVSGASDQYLRVVLDEEKMNQYGLTISEVGSAIAAADFDMPIGSVTMGSQDIALTASGDLDIDGSNIVDIPLQTRSGELVRIGDVCTFCNLYREEAESISRYNGNESVLMQVTLADSASTVSTCESVEDVLEELSQIGVSFETIYSEADSIVHTLTSVLKTLGFGVLFTMAVLLLFFGDLRASLIVGCSMPLSVFIAVFLLNLMGFDFDLMTGISLVIAIGMIVDNSIVVLESCMRAQERGLDFKEAALAGSGEILMSIFASTLTTVVVYIPLAMSEGMVGQMAHPLSWTIGLTMASSFICAITVVPLVFYLVKPKARENLPINRALDWVRNFYRRVMPSLLRHPFRVLLTAVAILLFTALMALQLDFVLFPDNYDGSVKISVSFRSGTKLEVMDQRVQELEQVLLADDNFEKVTMDLSSDTASFTAYAYDDAARSSEEAVEEYTERFANAVDMDIEVTPYGVGDMSAMMSSGNSVSISLMGDDLDSLGDGAAMVEEIMVQTPGVLQIENPFDQSRSQGKLVIDEQKAIAAGTSQAAVAGQISYLLNGLTACTIDYDDEEYDVVLEYEDSRYDDITSLMKYPIITTSGRYITLEDVAEIEYSTTLPSINRQDGQFIVTISATTTESANSDADSQINDAVAALELPDGVSQGKSMMDKIEDDEVSRMFTTMAIGIFLVFLVMAVQFDSPRLSLMVMICIPFSLIGSFGIMLPLGTMSIVGIMGFLMLFGIVVNNGILLVDAANEMRKTMPLEEALIQAGTTRLRPILMTTLTTILSMLPMIFTNDSGMAMMREMGYIIIGGLVASTVLTLFLMPSFYLLIRNEKPDGTKRWKYKKSAGEKAGIQERSATR